MSKKKKIIIASIASVIAAAAITTTVIIISSNQDQSFRLSDEYYAKSESIDVNKDEYEKLISDKKSFVILVDKPACYTTANMRTWMANFPDKLQFKYYRIMWEDAKESSLHQYVKFTPSVAVVREGKVVAWLQADKDEDADYFNSESALQSWITKYIKF